MGTDFYGHECSHGRYDVPGPIFEVDGVTQLAHALSHHCCRKSQVMLIHFMKYKDLTSQLLHQTTVRPKTVHVSTSAGFRAYW